VQPAECGIHLADPGLALHIEGVPGAIEPGASAASLAGPCLLDPGATMRKASNPALNALQMWERSMPCQLLELAANPTERFPGLLSRKGAIRLLAFPAASGVFVAYSAAKALALGDVFPFGMVLAGVVLAGAAGGVAALWLVGSLPDWSRERVRRRGAERAWLYIVFSYATWPFLPLLLLVGASDLLLVGTSAFSAARAPLPMDVVWALRILIGMSVLVWGVLMVSGTALVRYEPERRAAREVGNWLSVLAAVTLLLALLVTVVMSAW
jgi:hypothetical protein